MCHAKLFRFVMKSVLHIVLQLRDGSFTVSLLLLTIATLISVAAPETIRPEDTVNGTPSEEDCTKFCHQHCGQFKTYYYTGGYFPYTANYTEVRRCENATKLCTCGPNTNDFTFADCHYCHKNCVSSSLSNVEKAKCEMANTQCGCGPDPNREPTERDCEKYCNVNCPNSVTNREVRFCVRAQSNCHCGEPSTTAVGVTAFVAIVFVMACFICCYQKTRKSRPVSYRGNIQNPGPNDGGFIPIRQNSTQVQQNYRLNPLLGRTDASLSRHNVLLSSAPSDFSLPPEFDPPPPYSGIPGPK